MATQVAETCRRLLCNKVTIILPSALVGLFKNKYTKLHAVSLKQKYHWSVPINVKDRSALRRTATVRKSIISTQKAKSHENIKCTYSDKFFTVQDTFQVTQNSNIQRSMEKKAKSDVKKICYIHEYENYT